MALSVEKTGKTVEEAKMAALAELGIREDEATVEILEEASKGFFGIIGGHDAKVRVTAKEKDSAGQAAASGEMPQPEIIETSRQVGELVKKQEREEHTRPIPTEEEAAVPLEKAEKFLSQIFESMHLEVTIERERTENGFVLNLSGENLGILIGKHGQTLDSLQYLANLAANHGVTENRIHFILDVEHYRNRREETLCRLAVRLAEKAVRTRQRIMLEPMNRHERKIIHMALQDNRRISTYRAGDEPYRKVVIEPVRGRGGYRDRSRDRREAAAEE